MQQAAEANNVELLINDFREGLNANMCEAILQVPEDFPEIQPVYALQWSSAWDVEPELQMPVGIRMAEHSFGYIKSAAAALRRQQTAQVRTVQGRIRKLERKVDADAFLAENGDDAEIERLLWIAGKDQNGEKVRARVSMPRDEYIAACTAFMEERRVEITGQLERVGRSWALLEPSGFRVLPHDAGGADNEDEYDDEEPNF